MSQNIISWFDLTTTEAVDAQFWQDISDLQEQESDKILFYFVICKVQVSLDICRNTHSKYLDPSSGLGDLVPP